MPVRISQAVQISPSCLCQTESPAEVPFPGFFQGLFICGVARYSGAAVYEFS